MTLLLFSVFNLVLTLFLRGLIVFYKIILKKKFVVDQQQVFGLPVFIFFPILGLFLIGNISVIANILMSINQFRMIMIFIVGVFLIFNFYEKFQFDNKLLLITTLIATPCILAISSYGLKIHFDAIDYHLNFQYWIRESKIIFGLSNLYIAYGWSTIYDYILSHFWFGDNFIFLHYVNLLFFTLFYNFIFYNLIYSKNLFLKVASLNLLIFGLLDNFGIGGGANGFINIQMIGKPDVSVGVLFVICFMLFLRDFIEDYYSLNHFIFLTTLSLFAFQIKIVSSSLVFLLIYYVYKLIHKHSFLSILKKTSILNLFFFFYLLKNIFISGCLVFPVSSTCLQSLSWSDKSRVSQFSYDVSTGNNFSILGYESINSWFNEWINHSYNYQVFTNFLISLIIIGIFNIILFNKRDRSKKNKTFLIYMYCSFLVVSFLYTGPTFRYGFGLYLVLVSVIAINNNIDNYSITSLRFRFIYIGLFLITLSLTPRAYSYQQFLSSPLSFYETIDSTNEYLNHPALIDEKEIEYEYSKCYILKTCVKNDDYKNIVEEVKRGYLFYSNNN